MKVLVTGSEGMLGRAVVDCFADRFDVVGVARPDGDLTTEAVVDDLFGRHRPDWCVHTAGFTDVDGAEGNRQLAHAVNADATGNVARACRRGGAGLTYISTDYVFGGDTDGFDEAARRNPVNIYGQTKAQGEEAVEEAGGRWQILRTSWLFGPGDRNFVLTIRRLLRQGSPLKVVDDQFGCPTYAPDLAEVLLFLVQRGHPGYFHGTNRGACSWFDFAREIARLSGTDPGRVASCVSEEFPTPARRPRCSVLRSRNLEALGCPSRPRWQDALARYLRILDGGPPTS